MNATKLKPYKQIQQIHSKREKVGKECDRLREEINQLLEKKRKLERSHENMSVKETEDIFDFKESKRKIEEAENDIEAKADELEEMLGKGQQYLEEARRNQKKLYKFYFKEAESKRKQLFAKLEEVFALNDELKALEATNKKELGKITGKSHISFLDRAKEQAELNRKSWQEMVNKIETEFPE